MNNSSTYVWNINYTRSNMLAKRDSEITLIIIKDHFNELVSLRL